VKASRSTAFLKKSSKKLLLSWGMGVGLLLAALLVSGCSKPLAIQNFAGSGNFNPLVFFSGHVTSWGVLENRDGAPVGIITTDCEGIPDGTKRLRMVQVLDRKGQPANTRTWQMAQTGPQSFTASANDMAGVAKGNAAGRVFQWHWILQNSPGNATENVTMTQWMYQMDPNTVMIRTRVSKLGITVLQVSEVFRK
jgi:hypothetical protein